MFGKTRVIYRWWMTFLAATVMVVCGHLLIKAGLNAERAESLGVSGSSRLAAYISQPLILEGLFVYGVGAICWMASIAQAEVSFLYPLTSLNYVLVVGGSTVFFHEPVSVKRGTGLVLIVAGVALMNRRPRLRQR